MCSSGRLCGPSGRVSRSSSNGGSSSGSQYALCALGVGLIALGIVMIVWSVVPSSAASSNSSSGKPVDDSMDTKGKTSSVAFVLVGAGVAMLLLSICLSVRNKHRQQRHETQDIDRNFDDNLAEQHREMPEVPVSRYDVPSYEEVIGSQDYPVRQSNLRNSTSLPSYESLADALDNETNPLPDNIREEPSQTLSLPAATLPPPEPQPPHVTTTTIQPSSRNSHSSWKMKPLKVRRIKSEKLHLKDIRLNIRSPAQGGLVTIEPLTPPPQYEDKVPEL
ncbi:TMM51 protein, partial [Atractosteus spatula]|nr:TMM51 protein [Atractosteus spatula]